MQKSSHRQCMRGIQWVSMQEKSDLNLNKYHTHSPVNYRYAQKKHLMRSFTHAILYKKWLQLPNHMHCY